MNLFRYTVESVENVEDLIRHFDDFLATLDAQSPHFEALNKLTKLEQSYVRLKLKEQESREEAQRRRESGLGNALISVAEGPQPNRRDTQQIKTVEKKKILQEKRQERERRKTQEISLFKAAPATTQTAPQVK